MASTRKRTGASKRQQKQRLGAAKPPDESKIRSIQGATAYWEERGRYELTTGLSLRVGPDEDLAAFKAVWRAAHEHGRALAERHQAPMLVAGIEPIAARLGDIVSLAGVGEVPGVGQSPVEIVVAAGARFASARRRAIGRIAKGGKNRSLRHAFGVSLPLHPTNVDEVRNACLRLLAGRAEHPGTLAARMITPGDVKKARAFVAQLENIKEEAGARKSSDAQMARERDVLHAALELFYDRFAAAADLAFEDDDGRRVALLSLVPRRKERRAAAKPAAQAKPVPAAST